MTDGKPNRRQYQRVKIKQTISVADEKNLVLAEVDDLTVGGISFTADIELPKKSKFFVVFPGAGKIKENEVEAEVIRCDKVKSKQYHVAGKFLNANKKYMEDAVALVKGTGSKAKH